jgi:hypothetical protein
VWYFKKNKDGTGVNSYQDIGVPVLGCESELGRASLTFKKHGGENYLIVGNVAGIFKWCTLKKKNGY